MIDKISNARFYIIGVGPGDPDLLTLKAVRMIGMADVIAYPTLSDGQSRARKTVAEYITKLHEELPFHLPMAVDPTAAQCAYDGVSAKIRAYLKAGQSVALLCEGDPFFYGSAIHVYTRIAGAYTTRVVPGVSSLTAGAAVAGLPLTVRNDVLKVLPATLEAERLEAELEVCDAAVIIKVGRHFGKVARVIRNAGLGTYALLVSAASQDDQHIVAFDDLAASYPDNASDSGPGGDGEQPYFSMVLISRHKRAAQ